jgi:putative ABC transport system permease protein
VGIRLALGAQRREVLGLVIGRGMALTCAGLAIGLGVALGMKGLLQNLLFEVASSDPAIFIAMPILLAAVALLATSLPAWKASRVNPVVVLHEE